MSSVEDARVQNKEVKEYFAGQILEKINPVEFVRKNNELPPRKLELNLLKKILNSLPFNQNFGSLDNFTPVFVDKNGTKYSPSDELLKQINTQYNKAEQLLLRELRKKFTLDPSEENRQILEEWEEKLNHIEELATIKEYIPPKEENTIYTEKIYFDLSYFFKLIAEGKYSELAFTDIMQYQTQVSMPLWEIQRRALSLLLPKNKYIQKFHAANSKMNYNLYAEASGKPKIEISKEERTFATFQDSQYTLLASKAVLQSDGTYLVLESKFYSKIALLIGQFISFERMQIAAHILNSNVVVLDGYLADAVTGHHPSILDQILGPFKKISPIPLGGSNHG